MVCGFSNSFACKTLFYILERIAKVLMFLYKIHSFISYMNSDTFSFLFFCSVSLGFGVFFVVMICFHCRIEGKKDRFIKSVLKNKKDS